MLAVRLGILSPGVLAGGRGEAPYIDHPLIRELSIRARGRSTGAIIGEEKLQRPGAMARIASDEMLSRAWVRRLEAPV